MLDFLRLDNNLSTIDSPNVIVFCHGLGGRKENLKFLKRYVPQNTVLILPDGPIPTSYGFAWYFQISDDFIHLNLLLDSTAKLYELIRHIPENLKTEPKTLLLAGFSQGGTMALSFPLLYPRTIKHSACFGGYLPLHLPVNKLQTEEENPYGKFFWFHGSEDKENPYFLVEKGINRLNSYGIQVRHEHEPVGHIISAMGFDKMLFWWKGGEDNV